MIHRVSHRGKIKFVSNAIDFPTLVPHLFLGAATGGPAMELRMPPRPSPTPVASPELLATLLGPSHPNAPAPTINIHVAPGATLTFVVGAAPAGRAAEG
jgi:hypothetical protein